MDLALELGGPSELLARSLTEREFQRWQEFAQNRLLPTRRLEFYLAQIAMLIAVTMGGKKNVRLEDFMFGLPAAQVQQEEEDLQAAIEYFDFKPKGSITRH